MADLINDSNQISYVLNKCIPSIHSVKTSYGEIEFFYDDEARAAVQKALGKLYEKRYKKLAEKNER